MNDISEKTSTIVNSNVDSNRMITVEIKKNYPSHNLAGKTCKADLSQIVSNGGSENSEVLITINGGTRWIRSSYIKITDPKTRTTFNNAVAASLNVLPKGSPKPKRYFTSQLSAIYKN